MAEQKGWLERSVPLVGALSLVATVAGVAIAAADYGNQYIFRRSQATPNPGSTPHESLTNIPTKGEMPKDKDDALAESQNFRITGTISVIRGQVHQEATENGEPGPLKINGISLPYEGVFSASDELAPTLETGSLVTALVKASTKITVGTTTLGEPLLDSSIPTRLDVSKTMLFQGDLPFAVSYSSVRELPGLAVKTYRLHVRKTAGDLTGSFKFDLRLQAAPRLPAGFTYSGSLTFTVQRFTLYGDTWLTARDEPVKFGVLVANPTTSIISAADSAEMIDESQKKIKVSGFTTEPLSSADLDFWIAY